MVNKLKKALIGAILCTVIIGNLVVSVAAMENTAVLDPVSQLNITDGQGTQAGQLLTQVNPEGQQLTAEQIAAIEAQKAAQAAVLEQMKALKATQLNAWFADAGFVGNSVSVGLKTYFKSQGADYLGGAKVMAKESYSFANDGKTNQKFRISYGNVNAPAKDVIKAAGINKVFISMGTNDLWNGAESAYKSYIDYIAGIRGANPGILFFIEATTPVGKSKEKGGLNNKNVDELNSKMRAFCDANPDMFFIDINTPLKDANGGLNSAYSSDKFVHINMAGYKVWMNTVEDYVGRMIMP